MSMRATDAGYYGPNGGRGRGQYSHEEYRESHRRSATRASGSYEYGYPSRQPAGSGRGVDVRILDDDAPPPPPQRIRIKERQQPDIQIDLERAPNPRIRYNERGGGPAGYEEEYSSEPAPRRGGPRSEERYENGYEGEEEQIPFKPQRKPSITAAVIAQAEQEGPGFYEVNGQMYEAVETDRGWKVYRTNGPVEGPEVISVRSGGGSREVDRGGRPAEKPAEEKKKRFELGNVGRLALRVAGYGLLGAGAFYALSGVVGGVTNGMDWGPALGRTALNWQQAVPAIIGGGVMAAGGGLLLKFTKKKPEAAK
ncbi:MAG: hypothetical protein ACAI38_23060 [Myxococcota bacterium]